MVEEDDDEPDNFSMGDCLGAAIEEPFISHYHTEHVL